MWSDRLACCWWRTFIYIFWADIQNSSCQYFQAPLWKVCGFNEWQKHFYVELFLRFEISTELKLIDQQTLAIFYWSPLSAYFGVSFLCQTRKTKQSDQKTIWSEILTTLWNIRKLKKKQRTKTNQFYPCQLVGWYFFRLCNVTEDRAHLVLSRSSQMRNKQAVHNSCIAYSLLFECCWGFFALSLSLLVLCTHNFDLLQTSSYEHENWWWYF